MPEITKTKTRINLPNFTIDVSQSVGNQITLSVSGTGSVTISLSGEKRRELLEVLDVRRELAAGSDAIEENKLLRLRLHDAERERDAVKRALRLFRDFILHGVTQWKLGTNHRHPMWQMVSASLGDDNDRHPTQKEWAFIWPENTAPLEK